MAKQLTDPLQALAAARARRRKLLTVALGIAWVASLVVCYVVLPSELSGLWQRSLAAGSVLLALTVYLLATGESEVPDDVAYRIRRGQSADFGRVLRTQRAGPKTVRLPGLGETSWRAMIGAALVVILGAWWLTPWAPVTVRPRVVEDVTLPLGDEILGAVLAMPGENVAVLQWPIVPPRAREIVRLAADDDAYWRGLRAAVEGRHDDARALLAEAARDERASPRQVFLARAQNEMFAGRFAEATTWYARAIEAAPGDPTLLCQAAVAWMQAGEVARAEPLLAEALAAVEPLDSRASARAVVLHVRAAFSVASGKELDAAQRWCLQARSIFEETHGRQHTLVAASLNNQATIYVLRGSHHGAAQLYHGARDVWRVTLGPNHPHVATVLGNLGVLGYHLAAYAEAEREIEQAQAAVAQTLPELHPARAVWLTAGALVPLKLNRLDAARAPVEQALGLAEKAPGGETPAVAAAARTLGDLHAAEALYVRAAQYYLRATAAIRKHWHAEHPFMAEVLHARARILLAQARFDEAADMCDQAVAILRQGFGNDHPRLATALVTRAEIDVAQGNPRGARTRLDDALRIQRAALGKAHPDAAVTLGALASLDTSLRTYPEGVVRYQEAIATTRDSLGGQHPQVARLLVGLGRLHLERAKLDEAETCLKQALAIQEKAVVPYHPDLAATLETYAAVLGQFDPPKTEQAEAMLARARSIRQQHAAVDRPQ